MTMRAARINTNCCTRVISQTVLTTELWNLDLGELFGRYSERQRVEQVGPEQQRDDEQHVGEQQGRADFIRLVHGGDLCHARMGLAQW